MASSRRLVAQPFPGEAFQSRNQYDGWQMPKKLVLATLGSGLTRSIKWNLIELFSSLFSGESRKEFNQQTWPWLPAKRTSHVYIQVHINFHFIRGP